MIFVTVGTVMPFDRLIIALDEWAAAHPGTAVFAQIGSGTYLPKSMEWDRSLAPSLFREKVEAAEVVVAHAGIGSYLTSAGARTPLVMMPRRKALGEHTTDHQLATANWLRGRDGIFVAEDETGIEQAISEAMDSVAGPDQFSDHAPEAFVNRLNAYIRGREA
ncbi:glycosyltransferase [Pseudooceanicola sp. 502str34]